MRIRSALLGWATLLGMLGFGTAAEACYFQAPAVGWSPSARLPRSLAEADELAGQAREPMPPLPPGLTSQDRNAYGERFWPWFLRVTDAAARASAWYLTDAIGVGPFNEQAAQRWQANYEDEPLPQLGPSSAAYVLLGETAWTDLERLEAALGGPRVGISSEQYIDALASVGSLFEGIVAEVDTSATSEWSDYAALASETTFSIRRVVFYRCRSASTEMRTWTAASRRCEEWLGKHWKSQLELATLDELLPMANQVPLPQYVWAPLARNRAD